MGSTARGTGTLTFGTRQVDLSRGRVEGPVSSRLTALETAILTCLTAAGGQAVSREVLLRQAWG
ncbi:MAG TPA: hypothetical protein PLA94_13705 [Myxococcota bacterium]|nr:hypothetical protein [Myxococcota bacterium]HND31055.1 hypothetical protein [Myxococcota bacterium]